MDDGSCVFVEDLGCEECVNGEVVFLDEDGDGCCDQKWNDFGCSDPSACNYSNPCGGSSWECYYPEPIWCDACECAITPYDCNGALLPGFDANDNGLVDCLETAGCLIGDACNFNSAATLDDASCEFESCLGCTRDESSCNYGLRSHHRRRKLLFMRHTRLSLWGRHHLGHFHPRPVWFRTQMTETLMGVWGLQIC